MLDLNTFKKALEAEGFDLTDIKFVRAFRKAANPAGCEHCGANTKVAVPDLKKKNSYVLACCGRKAS